MARGPQNGEKPPGQLCRRAALMRWTQWTRKDIEYLVGSGRLRTQKLKPNSKPRYYVDSAQEILDGKG